MVERCKDPYLVQSVSLLPLAKTLEFDFLYGVYFLVDEASCFVDAGKGPFPKLTKYLEILNRHVKCVNNCNEQINIIVSRHSNTRWES